MSAISLVMALGILGAWVYGRYVRLTQSVTIDQTSYPRPNVCRVRTWGLSYAARQISCGMVTADFDLTQAGKPGSHHVYRETFPAGTRWRRSWMDFYGDIVDTGRWGFGTRHLNLKDKGRVDESWDVAVPAWLPVVVLLILPTQSVVGWWKRRSRARSNCCLVCGYDLRASSQRCPECGTAIESGKETHSVVLGDAR